MKYLKISDLIPSISNIGLGTFAINGLLWRGTNEKEVTKIILTAFNKGINLIDIAPAYGFGRAEQVVGKSVQEYAERKNVVISTKVGIAWERGLQSRNPTSGQIFKAIDDSLKRLRTDYIDISTIYRPDPKAPIEETASAMKQLYDQGKIRSIGVSNFNTEQMANFQKAAPLHFCQSNYNIFEPDIEKDIIPYCREENITLMAYRPLCRGLLSGSVKSDSKFVDCDLRKFDPKFKEPLFSQYLKAVEKLDEFAQKKYGKRVLHLAMHWVLDQIDSGITVLGARKSKQIEVIDELDGMKISREGFRIIDKIVKETIKDPVGSEFMEPPSNKIINTD